MKTWNQTIPLLHNDEQKVVANGYPDLCVNRVLGGSVESLDVKVLFNPLEEQFYLPPFAGQFCDHSEWSRMELGAKMGFIVSRQAELNAWTNNLAKNRTLKGYFTPEDAASVKE